MRQIGLCARREAITLRMIAATPVSVAFGFGRVRVRHDKGNTIKAIASPYEGSFAALRIMQHRRSIRQNMSRTSACAVLYSMLEVRDEPWQQRSKL
jgi:hypothetical protein